MPKFLSNDYIPLILALLIMDNVSSAHAEGQRADVVKFVVEQLVMCKLKLPVARKGILANHAKGVVATGVFTPSADAAGLTSA